MKRIFLLLASITVGLALASVVALGIPKEQARAAFRDRDGDYDLYIKDADGTGDPHRLTNQPGDDYAPDWQPVQ